MPSSRTGPGLVRIAAFTGTVRGTPVRKTLTWGSVPVGRCSVEGSPYGTPRQVDRRRCRERPLTADRRKDGAGLHLLGKFRGEQALCRHRKGRDRIAERRRQELPHGRKHPPAPQHGPRTARTRAASAAGPVGSTASATSPFHRHQFELAGNFRKTHIHELHCWIKLLYEPTAPVPGSANTVKYAVTEVAGRLFLGSVMGLRRPAYRGA